MQKEQRARHGKHAGTKEPQQSSVGSSSILTKALQSTKAERNARIAAREARWIDGINAPSVENLASNSSGQISVTLENESLQEMDRQATAMKSRSSLSGNTTSPGESFEAISSLTGGVYSPNITSLAYYRPLIYGASGQYCSSCYAEGSRQLVPGSWGLDLMSYELASMPLTTDCVYTSNSRTATLARSFYIKPITNEEFFQTNGPSSNTVYDTGASIRISEARGAAFRQSRTPDT